MSTCCRAIEDHFGAARVQSQLEELERTGPAEETSILVSAVTDRAAAGLSVLDIGAGLGIVAEQLLAAGARQAVLVDASAMFMAAARDRLVANGLADRVTVRAGDFVSLAADIDAADIVTLDKVICCYPNMRQLVDLSAQRASRFYAASYPRDRWPVRVGIWFENLRRRLQRNPFRAYVHPVTAIEERLRSNGFELRTVSQTFSWRVVLFERV